MQQNHPALLVDVKKYSRDTILAQARTHLIDTVAQWPANRHPDGPAKLHGLYVLADAFAILRRGHTLQLIPHGFSASIGAEEDRRDPFTLSFDRLRWDVDPRRGFGFVAHERIVPYTVHLWKQLLEAVFARTVLGREFIST